MKLFVLATRVLAIAIAASSGALQPFAAMAQDYPSKPIQLIIPFPPGGGVDSLGRSFAQALDVRLNQRVLPNNRGGAGQMIGTQALVQAPADGYTVMYSPVTPLTIQPHRVKNLPYSRDAVMPLCQTFESVFFVAAGPKSPLGSMRDLLEAAKGSPGKFRYSTAGVGSSPHLSGAELWLKAGVQLTDVPYASEAVGLPQLLSGEVDLGVVTTRLVLTQKLRPLAVFADRRVPQYPDVPTTAELGFAVHPSGFGGLFLRRDTPPAIVARLESACRQALEDPAYRKLTESQNQQAEYLDRNAFGARVDADFRSKGALIPTLKLPE